MTSLRYVITVPLKYYRQAYRDLVDKKNLPAEKTARYSAVIDRCFDRIELALFTEWTAASGEDLMKELQANNRFMTNEKNRYLTIFESHPNPILLLNRENKIDNINCAMTQRRIRIERSLVVTSICRQIGYFNGSDFQEQHLRRHPACAFSDASGSSLAM